MLEQDGFVKLWLLQKTTPNEALGLARIMFVCRDRNSRFVSFNRSMPEDFWYTSDTSADIRWSTTEFPVSVQIVRRSDKVSVHAVALKQHKVAMKTTLLIVQQSIAEQTEQLKALREHEKEILDFLDVGEERCKTPSPNPKRARADQSQSAEKLAQPADADESQSAEKFAQPAEDADESQSAEKFA